MTLCSNYYRSISATDANSNMRKINRLTVGLPIAALPWHEERMTKPAHTPGPWRVGIHHHTVYAEKGKEPCIALCPKNEARDWLTNARLIAAAPDLLAALERIAAHERRSDRRHTGMIDVEELETLQRIANVAIRKARGDAS